tara:strand:+ start:1543 stop:2010 length:468 start_codon:yes stop_codon:yes gene_type:complete
MWITLIGKAIGDLFGIGRDALNNRAKKKQLEADQKHSIIKAETDAIVHRIMSNTTADNEIDLVTARNKKYTWKDEIITYIFLIPIVVATVVPFIIAYENNEWTDLNKFIQDSYYSLDQLPEWYKWVLGAVVIDVLGFRSFARKIVDKWGSKKPLK